MIEAALDWLGDALSTSHLQPALRAAAVLVAGAGIAMLGKAPLTRWTDRHLARHNAQLMRQLAGASLGLMVLLTALDQLGLDLKVLLGAAGVFTVAIGFAAQTTFSNLISGLFLLGERPFVIGDTIRIGEIHGEIVSIDLLSIKVRTFDNLFVRVPSEMFLKTPVINYSHFEIRRLDLPLGVAYEEDLPRVRRILEAVAISEPLCLVEPAPVFQFVGFGDSALNLKFSVWVAATGFVDLQARLPALILDAFRAEGVEIPFPQRVVWQKGAPPRPLPELPDEAGSD